MNEAQLHFHLSRNPVWKQQLQRTNTNLAPNTLIWKKNTHFILSQIRRFNKKIMYLFTIAQLAYKNHIIARKKQF